MKLQLWRVDDEFDIGDLTLSKGNYKLGCTANGDIVIVWEFRHGHPVTSIRNAPPFKNLMIIEWMD